MERHNPYIRTIVRQTREYLESTADPATGEPLLARVTVRLHGESESDAISLPPFLADAYQHAETFCELLALRANTGFFRAMLLRRIGSTMEAGRLTVERILAGWKTIDDDDDEPTDELRTLTASERDALQRLGRAMESNQAEDPKVALILRLLLEDRWLEQGCIVFSQYLDSIWWLGNPLSGENQ